MEIEFSDRLVPYDRFLNDVAATVVQMIKSDHNDPEFLSQRQAWKLFGRRNVERWKKRGLVKTYKRPGRVEYLTADLRLLQRREQDYFK